MISDYRYITLALPIIKADTNLVTADKQIQATSICRTIGLLMKFVCHFCQTSMAITIVAFLDIILLVKVMAFQATYLSGSIAQDFALKSAHIHGSREQRLEHKPIWLSVQRKSFCTTNFTSTDFIGYSQRNSHISQSCPKRQGLSAKIQTRQTKIFIFILSCDKCCLQTFE